MNTWDDQLSTLRIGDEEVRENTSYMVQNLKTWIENLMITWDGRWIGYCKLHQDTIFLRVWILRDSRKGSPWISTSLTSDGEVIHLTGTGSSLHCEMDGQVFELPYINGTWHLSEDLQNFWFQKIADCIQQHNWAIWPIRQNVMTVQQKRNYQISNVIHKISTGVTMFVALSLVSFGTVMLISILTTGRP
jgi:hypothetical protein